MSYLKNEYSYNYPNSYAPDSAESEVEYLKVKLIETHSKLIRQLQYSKQLQETIKQWQHRYDSTMSQNESLVKKMNALATKSEKDRINNEKAKQLQLNLVQSQKKNDLLRIDLESMRTKILEFITSKQAAEQQRNQQEHNISKLNERLIQATRQAKQRQSMFEQVKQEIQRYKNKYDKQVSINKEIEHEVAELRKDNHELIKQVEELQSNIRQQKDKQGKNINQLLLVQKQAKEWRVRAQNLTNELTQVKEEIHMVKTRNKQEQRSLQEQLQKLTNDYNNLQSIFRQKEAQLQSARRRPIEDASRKKNKFEQTKEMVGKLQKEQQIKMAARGSPSPRTNKSKLSPRALSRTYKQEKQEYLSMIESVGTMQSQMLACNVQRKKILSEIDKIDQTRIKTKDMISRRRRLEVELQNQEKKLQQIRNQLKKMKVM